jgi:signal transduction histidine kinase
VGHRRRVLACHDFKHEVSGGDPYRLERFAVSAYQILGEGDLVGYVHRSSGKSAQLEEAKEALTSLIEDANRASEVISRIRALLKNDKPEYVGLDINGTIREVLTLTNGTLQGRNVLVRTRLSEGLPLILGDRIQLQQVIMNLIINGADAMSSVTSRPRILHIESHIDELGKVMIGIEDAGTGLDPSIADRIFDPLFTTKPNGMGMGLSICRSIVEAHGGHLRASPGSPHGAVFHFAIPALKRDVETH